MHNGRLVRVDEPEKIFVSSLLADVFNLKGELITLGVQRTLRLESLPPV
jgi:hypothetical protein